MAIIRGPYANLLSKMVAAVHTPSGSEWVHVPLSPISDSPTGIQVKNVCCHLSYSCALPWFSADLSTRKEAEHCK